MSQVDDRQKSRMELEARLAEVTRELKSQSRKTVAAATTAAQRMARLAEMLHELGVKQHA